MQTKLIVASGKSAGRAISVKNSKLLIGRAEDCDLRPLSEDVSRRHCAIHMGPADVWAEDLGSRNGTFVNGVRISEKTRLSDGDMIRVGVLELKVSCSKPAPAGGEEDVSKWLMADDAPAGMFDTTQALPVNSVSTGDSDSIESSNIHTSPPTEGIGSGVTQSGISSKSGSNLAIEAIKQSQAKPGILPAAAKKSADSSRDAAAEALRKFFNNR